MVKRFRNILFVADREDGLDAALERAVAVSRTNAARLTVMDVTPDAGLDSYPNHCINSDCNKVMQRASIHPGNATTRISRRGWHSWSG